MKKSPVKTWSTPAAEGEKRLVPCALCGGMEYRPALDCEGFSYVRCVSCGLVQMNPQPLEREIRRRYGSPESSPPGEAAGTAPSRPGDYGKDYLAYESANEEAFLNLQLLALKDADFDSLERELFSKKNPVLPANAAPEESGGKPRVLDIGCALGSLLFRLKSRGWETAGVEISAPQAEYARRRGLDIRGLPLEENRFPEASFDVVLASHLIEHLNDPAGMVREVHRLLVPGGRFFVTTPNIAGFQARLFKGRWRSAIFDHLYLFSKKSLSRLLEEKGFVIEKTASWGGLAAGIAPAPIKRLFDKAAKRFGFGDVMIIRGRKAKGPSSKSAAPEYCRKEISVL